MKKLLGIGALIDQSWDQYRKHFPMLIKISAWALVVTAVNVIAISMYPINASELTRSLNGWEITGLLLFVLNNTILAIVVGVWIVNALITAIHNFDHGKKIKMVQIHKVGWKLFWPQVLVRIYLALVFGLTFAIPMFAFWLVTNIASTFLPSGILFLLLFAALILFLAPLAVLVYLAFAVFALVVSGHQGTKALKESIRLVKGRFWPVVMRLFIPKLLYFGIFFLAQVLLVMILEVAVFGLLGGADELLVQRVNWLILPTSYTVLFIFINPLLLITDHKIYRDLI
ncbi:hypothetical protein HOI83_04490 [Candidatus Uhrbacteria bacterium]|jgi:hypothetical protein|nr:hypothetical protein [Candidatus Uhrbacteria bacterium]